MAPLPLNAPIALFQVSCPSSTLLLPGAGFSQSRPCLSIHPFPHSLLFWRAYQFMLPSPSSNFHAHLSTYSFFLLLPGAGFSES